MLTLQVIKNFHLQVLAIEASMMFSVIILLATDSWISSDFPYYSYLQEVMALFQLYLENNQQV